MRLTITRSEEVVNRTQRAFWFHADVARRAVVFDLFGTLVPAGGSAERDEVSRQMATLLDVDPEAFAGLMRQSFDQRARGRLGSLTESVRHLARLLGADPPEPAVEAAVELRLDLTRALHARTWAVPVLAQLGRAGVLRGLVSDCSAETPAVWSESPLSPHLDAVSFSCLTGHRKPAHEAYEVALRQLGVEAGECLYVGDGGSRELTGATALGMAALRYAPGGAVGGDVVDQDLGWSGGSIGDLAELPGLLENEASS